MKENWITSIGLDIGTSTTKFIVSRLFIAEGGDSFSLPSCEIIDRQIYYTSEIYTTPLNSDYEIDIEQLTSILEKEYERSRTTLSDVKAGAVIITGETARKKNAEAIIHYLADRAGDFVIATAGSSLEAVLAGKGSGARERSEKLDGIVANVDVGGGTANIALFYDGKAFQTFTFHIGGRLIRLNKNGKIVYISSEITTWFKKNAFHYQLGDHLSFIELELICLAMSKGLVGFLESQVTLNVEHLLLESSIPTFPLITEMLFSGGIGKMMNESKPNDLKDVTRYGDFGPLLASNLKVAVEDSSIKLHRATETTRATVIGAGMQNTEVSGATVYIKKELLPMKNIPIVKASLSDWNGGERTFLKEHLLFILEEAKNVYEIGVGKPFALGLLDLPYCNYDQLQTLSVSIYETVTSVFPDQKTIIILCERDMAKALGQSVARKFSENNDVLCIDQIYFSHGDYIDLGFPVAGEAISISVKTLAF